MSSPPVIRRGGQARRRNDLRFVVSRLVRAHLTEVRVWQDRKGVIRWRSPEGHGWLIVRDDRCDAFEQTVTHADRCEPCGVEHARDRAAVTIITVRSEDIPVCLPCFVHQQWIASGGTGRAPRKFVARIVECVCPSTSEASP